MIIATTAMRILLIIVVINLAFLLPLNNVFYIIPECI